VLWTRRSADAGPLAIWLASRIAVVVLALAGLWSVFNTPSGVLPSFRSLWNHWDVQLFVKVARWGYTGYPRHYPDKGIVAFFPGEPLLLRLVHLVVRDWVVSGLLISFVAGAVACVYLARLAGGATGTRAALYLVLSPYAVFLFVGYSEALFLAFALPAWLAARQRRWAVAGVLAGAAATVRVTGVALGLALLVEALSSARGAGQRARAAAWAAIPLLVTVGYFAYLRVLTGDWLAWSHAQAAEWGRRFTWPWRSFMTTWNSAWHNGQGPAYAWSFRADIAALLVGVALVVVLVVTRRWAEAVYVGIQVVAFACSSYYLSVARATLLWWPFWLLLARWSMRRPAVNIGYLALSTPIMAAMVLAFAHGHWVD
jgi:hypothetical protein